MIIKKVFIVPTVGERGNRNNPLKPAVTPPSGVAHIVKKYINNDKQAIIVVFGKTNSDFEPYRKKGKEITKPAFNLARFKHRHIKNNEVIDSTEFAEVGKKEWELYNLSKEEFLKRLKHR